MSNQILKLIRLLEVFKRTTFVIAGPAGAAAVAAVSRILKSDEFVDEAPIFSGHNVDKEGFIMLEALSENVVKLLGFNIAWGPSQPSQTVAK